MAREPTSQIIDILATKAEQASARDYFALLDLQETADDTEIRKAYFRLARVVHPDSIKKQALENRKDEAALVFEKLTEAYDTLRDPQRRAAYLRSRQQGTTLPPAPGDSKLAEEQAKIALHQGKLLLNRRAYAEAEKHFRLFASLKPDDSRGHLFVGWCLMQNPDAPLESRLGDAHRFLAKALALAPDSDEATYFMALYFKARGDHAQVEKHLQKTLELNKSHIGAQREKRLLEMRSGQKPAQPSVGEYLKGLWSKLSKKSADKKE